jgi:hypothetical protein
MWTHTLHASRFSAWSFTYTSHVTVATFGLSILPTDGMNVFLPSLHNTNHSILAMVVQRVS